MKWWDACVAYALAVIPLSILGVDERVAGSRSVWSTDCRVCHPGATKGLAQSVHAGLGCATCHGDASEHAEAARKPEFAHRRADPVAAWRCAACHTGGVVVAEAAHAWRRDGAQGPSRVLAEREPAEWSGGFEIGWRFVDVDGTADRFRTDLDLDSGPRLLGVDLLGRRVGVGGVDEVELGATRLGDPHQRAFGRVRGESGTVADGAWSKSTYSYRASGDFHRVDRDVERASFGFRLPTESGAEWFGDVSSERGEGFWLTQRIGNRNVLPQTVVDGVASPREFDAVDLELGVDVPLGRASTRFALGYRDERALDRWTFSRPAPSDAAVVESEDFGSSSTLRGPEATWSLHWPLGDAAQVDLAAWHVDLDRRVRGRGVSSGVDVEEFTTSTSSDADGSARTIGVDAGLVVDLHERVTLLADLRWSDHAERLVVRQFEDTVATSGSFSTSAMLEQRTSRRAVDGAVEIVVAAHEAIDVHAGYGFARETLRLPDLFFGDTDFVSGTRDDHGFLAGFDVRPDAKWTWSARFEDWSQSGPRLHEMETPTRWGGSSRLRYRAGATTLGLSARHRRGSNSDAAHRDERTSIGLSVTTTAGDESLSANLTFSEVELRTLTSFFFDPDPNPVPTVVGFEGETWTASVAVAGSVTECMHWSLDGAFTETRGTLDVRLIDISAEFAVDTHSGGQCGVSVRHVEYDEAVGGDDYAADMLFVFWRQRFGAR